MNEYGWDTFLAHFLVLVGNKLRFTLKPQKEEFLLNNAYMRWDKNDHVPWFPSADLTETSIRAPDSCKTSGTPARHSLSDTAMDQDNAKFAEPVSGRLWQEIFSTNAWPAEKNLDSQDTREFNVTLPPFRMRCGSFSTRMFCLSLSPGNESVIEELKTKRPQSYSELSYLCGTPLVEEHYFQKDTSGVM